MTDNERVFGVYQTEADMQQYKLVAEVLPEFRDWDPMPRPIPFDLGKPVTPGHIALIGDFAPKVPE
jgi:hypothetical protein